MKTITRMTLPVTAILLLLTGSITTGCTSGSAQSPSQHVDQYIGTGGHGHVFMGANVPFGLVQLGPTQFVRGWDWTSGYHYSDSTILGFGHMHLSGTGIGDLGDVSLMPVVGDVKTVSNYQQGYENSMYSLFSHDTEKVEPGYYAVRLDRYGIDVELTATQRCGFHKYTFPKADDAKIVIDLERGIGWDTPYKGYVERESETAIVGFRQSYGWARNQQVYFVAEFSKPMKDFKVLENVYTFIKKDENGKNIFDIDLQQREGDTISGPRVYAQAIFDTEAGEAVYVKVGISAVSIENARQNLKAEIPAWDFDKTIADATVAWDRELGKIGIETNDEEIRKIFYTAMYHTLIAPSVFNDVNGAYRGSDYKVHEGADFTNYTTFSLWDTYRAAHPLITLIRPEITKDIAATFINIYKQQGKLPVWHLVGNETDCMVGNSGVPVLADLVLKGYDVDAEEAFEAMKVSMMRNERGLRLLREYGYLPFDKDPEHETVAKGLEYALDDWAVAQVAKKLGKQEDYEYFLERSMSYKKYFDPETRFMRGLSSEGKFREPFDPLASTHRADDYTEGNAWQYTWLVPHDVRGLIGLFGGEEAFTAKLDALFEQPPGVFGEDASPDISGFIGQYAHGNEPGHHILYLYAYVGQQWKTAEKVREVLYTLYHADPDGLSGNEDVGQMSAWYIMSAIGLYQVAPAGGIYVFGSPIVDRAKLDVGDGKTFEIVAHGNSRQNIYIQSAKLNGQPYEKSYITHDLIVAGGTLEFVMGDRPSDFGKAVEARP